MKMTRIFALVIAFAVVATSCKKDDSDDDKTCPPPEVTSGFKLMVNGKFGSEDFQLNETFTDPEGSMVKLELLKFFLSEIYLIKQDGSEVKVSDVELIDFDLRVPQDPDDPDWFQYFEVEAEPGNYRGMRCGVGVPSALNHTDPSTYDNHHPLGNFSNMNWNWNDNYKFIALDGKADTLVTTSPFHVFQYHVGLDDNYRTLPAFVKNFSIEEGQVTTFDISVDVQKFFYTTNDTISILSESGTHTVGSAESMALATRFMDQVALAFSVD